MSLQLANSVALATRGECAFTAKANIAQAGGAAGLLVINDNEGIKKRQHVMYYLCSVHIVQYSRYPCQILLQNVIHFVFLELYKMVCSENDTSINVTIPVVMIPQSSGKKLKAFLDHGASGKLFLNYPSSVVKYGMIHYSFYIALVVEFSYFICKHLLYVISTYCRLKLPFVSDIYC